MSFLVFLVCGVIGGVLGGMGMGGGTALIPLLTIFCGVKQGVAQGVNLLAFLPMSVVALTVHAKSGLLQKEGLLPLVLPALATSAALSFLATRLPSEALRTGFGVFLLILSIFRFAKVIKMIKSVKNEKVKQKFL